MALNALQHAIAANNHQKSGNTLQAEASIKKALLIEPKNADFLHFLGLIKYQKKILPEAISLISHAIRENAKKPIFHYNLGVILKERNQLKDALFHQQQALKLAPTNIHYMNEVALIHIERESLDDAKATLEKAIQLSPNDALTYSNLSYLYRRKNEPRKSIELAQKAIALNPGLSQAYMNIGQSFILFNQFKKGILYIKKSFKYGSHHLLASQQSLLLNLLYTNDYSVSEIFKEHEMFCQQYLPSKQPSPLNSHGIIKQDKKDRISIGIISRDFRFHAVFHFIIAILTHYNKNKFQFYGYSGVSQPDSETAQIKSKVDYWRDINEKTTNEIIDIIKKDQIDILIDLAGHTKGNYLPVFAAKPAKIQVSFLGYPFSTGLSAIDYRITDEYTDPKDTTKTLHSENLIKISPSFLCYTPYSEEPLPQITPIEKNGFITFGSFNKFNKLSIETLECWANILHQVEDAQLVLKNNQPISTELSDHFHSFFHSKNIQKHRIKIVSPTQTITGHMSYYHEIDIALDPFPYNGTTTTCEALWMGVPVICLSGNDHRSRVGNSILNTLGLEYFLAETKKMYCDVAVDLANKKDEIIKLRKTLRQDLKASLLTDGKIYTKKFENLMLGVLYQHTKNNIKATKK